LSDSLPVLTAPISDNLANNKYKGY